MLDPPLPPLSEDDTFYLLVETLPALYRIHPHQATARPLRFQVGCRPGWLS
jgi:hypothetical protein